MIFRVVGGGEVQLDAVLVAEILEGPAGERRAVITSHRSTHAKSGKPPLELPDCVLIVRADAHLLVEGHAAEVIH